MTLKTITNTELEAILDKHKKWLNGDADGKRAILSGYDLRWRNLSGRNLRGSDLRGSDLSCSDLSCSDLSDSDLRGSDLSDSDLSGSDLRGSDLRGSDLSCSDLSDSDLRGSDISGCDMYNACLPLWCGGLHFRADRLFVAQLAYHLCSIICDDEAVKAVQRSLYAFANEFARSRYDLRDKLYPEPKR